jgi:hypothetical protein
MPSLAVWYCKLSKGDPFKFETDRDFAMTWRHELFSLKKGSVEGRIQGFCIMKAVP